MKGADAVVTREISGVGGKNALDCVDAHDRDEAGIVDFDALDSVFVDDPFSRGVDSRHVGQQG